MLPQSHIHAIGKTLKISVLRVLLKIVEDRLQSATLHFNGILAFRVERLYDLGFDLPRSPVATVKARIRGKERGSANGNAIIFPLMRILSRYWSDILFWVQVFDAGS